MKTDTFHKIFGYIEQKKEATAKDIIAYLSLTPAAVFRQLKKLLEKGLIVKTGHPPKVFYHLPGEPAVQETETIDKGTKKIIEENYLLISPEGNLHSGWRGFVFWCQRNNLEVKKTASEYVITWRKYQNYKKNGLIDGRQKFQSTFKEVFVNEVYYLDFYSIERFGKTKLGTLLLYAKQSQNQELMRKISELVKDKITGLIKTKKIDAVAFIPPTIPRKIQLLKELENLLGIPLPKIKLVKVTNNIPIAQKSLSKLKDRIENARSTIFVDEKNVFKNILIIDDAVGSGATLNETARKIKEKRLCRGRIIALALTGSFKGFDVISEV